MEKDLIQKIKELLDNQEGLEETDWFINTLNEYVCTFKYNGNKYIITIEELERRN